MSRRGFSKPKGHFENGAWMCNCNPRLPAVRFQSTKGKPENKGRWFYTCQKGPSDKAKCDFFLWQEDAQPRELAALRNNTRTEPDRAAPAPARQPEQGRTTPPPPYTIESVRGTKRRADAANNRPGDDDFGLEAEDTAFQNELDQAMAAAETPRKAARTESNNTPRRRLDFDHQSNAPALSTPQTDRRSAQGPFATPFAPPGGSLLTPSSRKNGQSSSTQEPTPASSPYDTPSRIRSTEAVAHIDLTQDVFALFEEENVHLPDNAEMKLRRALNKHAKIAEGNRRGRDVLRLELKAKEAKIAGLEKQLDTLKAELEANEAARRFQQWQEEQEND